MNQLTTWERYPSTPAHNLRAAIPLIHCTKHGYVWILKMAENNLHISTEVSLVCHSVIEKVGGLSSLLQVFLHHAPLQELSQCLTYSPLVRFYATRTAGVNYLWSIVVFRRKSFHHCLYFDIRQSFFHYFWSDIFHRWGLSCVRLTVVSPLEESSASTVMIKKQQRL